MKRDNKTVKENKAPTKIEELKSRKKGDIIIAIVFQLLPLLSIFFVVAGVVNKGDIVSTILCLVMGFMPAEVVALVLLLDVKKCKKLIENEEQNPTKPPELFAKTLFKDDGYTYNIACDFYCKNTGKNPKKFTREDENAVWDYAYDDFSYLLMWIIENNFYQPSKDFDEDTAADIKEVIAKIKKREEVPSYYLTSNDGCFMEDEVKKKAREFVIEYFKGSYMDDVKAFAKEHLKNAELYGFPFRFEDYDVFKVRIDEAYAKYKEENEQLKKENE